MHRVITFFDGWKSINVYRGERPASHSELRSFGFKHRIDLQTGIYEELHEDKLEWENPKDFGIVLHNLSFSDIFPPSTNDIKTVLALIRDAEGAVYIHCLHGKDRTGYVSACLEAMSGEPFLTIILRMFAHGFHKFPYIWWLIPLYFHYRWLRPHK